MTVDCITLRNLVEVQLDETTWPARRKLTSVDLGENRQEVNHDS